MRICWAQWLVIAVLGCVPRIASGQYLTISPQIVSPIGSFSISDSGGASGVKFKLAGVASVFGPAASGFLVIIPSSGATPAAVNIGVNPSGLAQLRPATTYAFTVQFATVDRTPVQMVSGQVRIIVPAEPAPAIQSVVNAASLQPSLSPGAAITILGSHLTGPTQSTTYDDTGSYPTSVASTSVTFNGIAAPLLYVSPGQINAIVPYAVAGQTTVQVVVQRFEMVSAAFTMPLRDTSPGIYTATQTGAGQGAILQQGVDGQFTYNSSTNPAPRGAALEIFATGAGVWTPPAQADIFFFGEFFKTQPVSVTIGAQPANILYAGTLAFQANWSVLQVNAVVPAAAGSGPQPVVLKIGANDNSQQKVTVWVQ
jgi:trimeric autotransporter adhesin